MTVRVYAGAGASGTPLRTLTAAVGSGGAYTATVSPALPDGGYSAKASQSDDLAHTGASGPVTFGVDTRAPNTSILSGPSGETYDSTPTFAFAASEPGATLACRLDGRAWTRCRSPYTSPALPDGAHRFAVAARDRAGNLDHSPAARAFTVVWEEPSSVPARS